MRACACAHTHSRGSDTTLLSLAIFRIQLAFLPAIPLTLSLPMAVVPILTQLQAISLRPLILLWFSPLLQKMTLRSLP